MHLYPIPSDRLETIEETIDTRIFILFIVFQLVGFCGLITMFFTAVVSPLVKRRHPIWLSFVVAWIVSSVSYSLLTGTSPNWEPPYPLCLTQAVMIYTVPTLTASTSLSLVIHVLFTVRAFAMPANSTCSQAHRGVWTFLLIFLPYLFSAGMFTLSLVIGLRNHSTVTRPLDGFYCNMKDSLPGKLSAIIVAGIMIIAVCLDTVICIILRRNWHVITNETHSPIGMVVRVLAFSTFSLVAIVLGLIFFFTPRPSHGAGLEIVLSLLPIAAFLVFGTHEDLIQSWKAGFRLCFQFMRSCLCKMISNRFCLKICLSKSGSTTRLYEASHQGTGSQDESVLSVLDIAAIPMQLSPSESTRLSPSSRTF